MADQENIPPRLTRAAAKRCSVMEDAICQPQFKRKRIALSDVHNLTNAVRVAVKTTKTTRAKKKVQETKSAEASCKEIEVQEAKTDECSCKEIDASNVSISISDASDEGKEVEDPQMVAPYASDIYQYLRSMEVEPKRRPLPNYMETAQVDISADMRAVLIDWLVDVAEEFKLVPETLYLTTSYMDRFLSYNSINRRRLQLLGVSSMLIASKYEEIYPPKVDDFCSITANTYNKQEVVQMERDLLSFLKFEIGTSTINTFLQKFLKDKQDDVQNSNLVLDPLACYLAELSLIDYGCIKFLPSVVAASAVFLARFTIDPTTHPWNRKLERSTGYKAGDLKECIYALQELQSNMRCSSLIAIKEKYKKDKFKCASTLLPQKEKLHILFDKLEEESSCETKLCINGHAVR